MTRTDQRAAGGAGDIVGRLLSVNVGGPREVAWEGKAIRTAIWKDPVAGRRMVRRLNIDGDDQADRAAHGGEHRAVFVYQIEAYRYWERELGRDDFAWGQFGENFTVEGLPDDEVCIGDRYRIGEALFEVTQPRVTCFRLGLRMAEVRMPSLVVAHHRPGFYLRVLQEGTVAAGDVIERVRFGPEQLTVAEADGLLYLPHKSRSGLERALRIPALSDGWKGSFRALLERSEVPAAPSAPAWAGFVVLTVTEVRRESDAIVSFTLAADTVDPSVSAAVSPGQYLSVRLHPQGAGGPAVIRSYSLSLPAAGDGTFRISVKREPGGVGSGYMQTQVRAGDRIETAAPRGAFTLRAGTRPVALISAGVGATPVLAMLHALADAGDEREVWWVHGARDRAAHAFGREVEELLARLPRAHRIVSLSRPRPEDLPGAEFDRTGRISIETLREVPVDSDYYLCGPDAFMRSLSAAITARGTAPEHVAMELFGSGAVIAPPGLEGSRAAPHAPAGTPGAGPAVTFSRSGLTVPWGDRHGNLLELAEACDVPVSFGCRNGVCHSCESGLLDGKVRYVTEPLERPDDSRVLVCCAQPAGPVTLEL